MIDKELNEVMCLLVYKDISAAVEKLFNISIEKNTDMSLNPLELPDDMLYSITFVKNGRALVNRIVFDWKPDDLRTYMLDTAKRLNDEN